MIKLNFIKTRLTSIITTPFILSSLFLGIGFTDKKLIAETIIPPATYEDLARYEWMGASYLCLSREMKFTRFLWFKQRFPFEKALSAATSTFVNAILVYHGGLIENNGEVITVDPNRLYENGSFMILAGAMQYCPDLIPEKSRKQFEEINALYLQQLEAFENQNNQ